MLLTFKQIDIMPNEEVKQELVEFEETGGYIPPTDGSEPVVSELPGTIETGTNVSAEAATTTTGQMVGNLASVPGFMLPVTQVKVGYVLYWPEKSKAIIVKNIGFISGIAAFIVNKSISVEIGENGFISVNANAEEKLGNPSVSVRIMSTSELVDFNARLAVQDLYLHASHSQLYSISAGWMEGNVATKVGFTLLPQQLKRGMVIYEPLQSAYIVVDKVILSGGNYYLEAAMTIYDYINEHNLIELKFKEGRALGTSPVRMVSQSELDEWNVKLATKAAWFNKYTSKLLYKPVRTVGTYYCITPELGFASATDDGQNSTANGAPAHARFYAGNYFTQVGKDLHGLDIITKVRNVFRSYAIDKVPRRSVGTYYYITSELTVASANDNLQNDTPDGNKAWARHTVGNYFTAAYKDIFAAAVITDVRKALQNHSITSL